MKVAIVGSRKCKFIDIAQIISKLPKNCTRIISGGAIGIDTAAETLASDLGIPFTKYEPDYKTFGIKAPLIRNVKIVENADLVLAFWDFESRGTAHTIAQCIKRQVPVRIFRIHSDSAK